MSECTAEVQIEYGDLIREVYIEPIRSVLVIDDEYPTLDRMIAKELGDDQPWDGDKTNVQKVKQILEFCRRQKRPWIVDVHDGKKVTVNQDAYIAPYLHQSDLVILDYHLDGDNGSGEKAIEILRKLAGSDHFNMVIIYTKGYDGPDSVDKVVQEIAIGLSSPDSSFNLPDEKIRGIKDGIEAWEIEDDEILKKFKSEVTEQTYLAVRSQRSDLKKALGLTECKTILELYKDHPKTVSILPQDLLQWLLIEKEKEIKNQLSPIPLGNVTLAANSGEINWIRTDRIFISVIHKSNQPNQIPGKLLQALNKWCPQPHRLLMAKMRSLIDERGTLAEAEVLGNDFIQAGWLLDFLDTHNSDKIGAIRKTINRHWEALGDALTMNVAEFGKRLTKYIAGQERKQIIDKYSPLNPDGEAQSISKYFNCYVSTKPVEGFHLTTGHILEFGSGEEKKEYGVCLSPACDMVPDQKKSGWYERLGAYMPFILVFLDEVKDNTALTKIDQNLYLFLNISGEIRTFAFTPSGDVKANPTWEHMYADNKGCFSEDDKEMIVRRICGDPQNLKIDPMKVSIVAQLRYEYALNLLQRLGISMTRIGLDFRDICQQRGKKENLDG